MILNILDNGVPNHVSLSTIRFYFRNHVKKGLYNVVKQYIHFVSNLLKNSLSNVLFIYSIFFQVLVSINYCFQILVSINY